MVYRVTNAESASSRAEYIGVGDKGGLEPPHPRSIRIERSPENLG
jgi:hypothetical protein